MPTTHPTLSVTKSISFSDVQLSSMCCTSQLSPPSSVYNITPLSLGVDGMEPQAHPIFVSQKWIDCNDSIPEGSVGDQD